MPKVNPDILVWARETAGMSLDDAAASLGIKDARGKSGAERLGELESGDSEPSRPQLLKMAQKYRRSLLVFYLDEPPRQGDRGEDFRSAPGRPPVAFDPMLDALIRDIRARQSVVRSVLEDEEAPSLDFIASADMNQGPENVARRMLDALQFDRNEFRAADTVENAFAYLRSRIEGAGIFVLLIGNLGSHHSNISTDAFRGFAIADSIAPFVVINDQDARQAWSFTALHEVCHLWLGTTGISGSSHEARIERFCNDVAARILLPPEEMHEFQAVAAPDLDDLYEHISRFAEDRKISRAMVSYQLLRSDLIARPLYQALNDRLRQEWLDSRERKKTKEGGESRGGPSYYVVKRHRLGPALLGLAQRALSEGALTPTKAGQLLGVKPRNVAPLLQVNATRGGT